MAKKKQNIPSYGTAEINGATYFRTRITDADGKLEGIAAYLDPYHFLAGLEFVLNH